MSALNMKPEGLAIAVLAIGGLWYLTQRRAGATGLPGFGRSPLAPSSGVAAANTRFFTSPAAAGQAMLRTGSPAAAALAGPLAWLKGALSPPQASVTSAIPSDMRASEKASYDLDPTADTLPTGDFARMDRAAVSDDVVAANPTFSDPYDAVDLGQYF